MELPDPTCFPTPLTSPLKVLGYFSAKLVGVRSLYPTTPSTPEGV